MRGRVPPFISIVHDARRSPSRARARRRVYPTFPILESRLACTSSDREPREPSIRPTHQRSCPSIPHSSTRETSRASSIATMPSVTSSSCPPLRSRVETRGGRASRRPVRRRRRASVTATTSTTSTTRTDALRLGDDGVDVARLQQRLLDHGFDNVGVLEGYAREDDARGEARTRTGGKFEMRAREGEGRRRRERDGDERERRRFDGKETKRGASGSRATRDRRRGRRGWVGRLTERDDARAQDVRRRHGEGGDDVADEVWITGERGMGRVGTNDV